MLLTLVVAVVSLCFGQYGLSISDVLNQLAHPHHEADIAHQIVWSVRLPRILMALLAGGALGLCGATLQGVFQNPLVDPHIIGVTSGSSGWKRRAMRAMPRPGRTSCAPGQAP